jgi:hypothetical protein
MDRNSGGPSFYPKKIEPFSQKENAFEDAAFKPGFEIV